jgi:hypothetical protein
VDKDNHCKTTGAQQSQLKNAAKLSNKNTLGCCCSPDDDPKTLSKDDIVWRPVCNRCFAERACTKQNYRLVAEDEN